MQCDKGGGYLLLFVYFLNRQRVNLENNSSLIMDESQSTVTVQLFLLRTGFQFFFCYTR